MEPARRPPRFHVGVMATCCLFLALSVVVARESSLSGARPSAATVVQVHRTGPGSMTESTQPSRRPEIATSRHRQTRETLPLPRLAGSGEDYAGVPPAERRVRRSRLEPKVHEFPPEPLVFLPARGRRFGEGASVDYPRTRADKRQLTIEQMLEKGDYFVPNRGKKAARSTGGTEPMKKNQFDVLLGTDEYFFPNRGKKEYFLAYDGRPRPLESRLRRNLLQNLANEHKDTFFSSRGKRMPEELELGPVVEQEIREALSGSLAEDCSTTSASGCAGVLAGEIFGNIGENTLATGQTDPNAVLLNDDVLLPFARVVS